MALSPGSRLGPYEVLARIGEGGMGTVWKARDLRLGRIVAIKQLHGAHSDRFEQEARAIAALNHPSICTLHDVGPDFLVMEYVEGAPLRGPLTPAEALRLAVQIAGGIEAAHRRGILHRDLKPANILVGESGAKLLDFGLAKIVTGVADVTQTGSIVGTAAYMAPEQAQGLPVDERSDVFSFGAVLYEMLSGRQAFGGATFVETLASVVHDEPRALDTAPPPLAAIVGRCLKKSARERFQTITDVRAALEGVSPTGPHPEAAPSIAVLPFASLGAEPENEYFGDGLAEEIMNALAQVDGLKVIARASAFSFKGKSQDVRQIAHALGVTHVLDGSVRRSGGRVRVTAQLVAASDGAHAWSQRFDRPMTDVFAMQDEMAEAITTALKGRLGVTPARPRQYVPNLDAYERYPSSGRTSWRRGLR
jgi:TolB-like protein/predicted Ser/Thr protein kinase